VNHHSRSRDFTKCKNFHGAALYSAKLWKIAQTVAFEKIKKKKSTTEVDETFRTGLFAYKKQDPFFSLENTIEAFAMELRGPIKKR